MVPAFLQFLRQEEMPRVEIDQGDAFMDDLDGFLEGRSQVGGVLRVIVTSEILFS